MCRNKLIVWLLSFLSPLDDIDLNHFSKVDTPPNFDASDLLFSLRLLLLLLLLLLSSIVDTWREDVKDRNLIPFDNDDDDSSGVGVEGHENPFTKSWVVQYLQP